MLVHKEQGTVEGVLLQLAARSRDVVKVVIRLLVKSRGDSVPKMLDYGTFMSRFKEVGKVEVRFLRKGLNSGQGPVFGSIRNSLC